GAAARSVHVDEPRQVPSNWADGGVADCSIRALTRRPSDSSTQMATDAPIYAGAIRMKSAAIFTLSLDGSVGPRRVEAQHVQAPRLALLIERLVELAQAK